MSGEKNGVAIIVITHNGKHHLKECFESLTNQTYKNFDCYLLDNASTDGSAEYVKENFPWVKIIRLKRNYGFAEGYNYAVKKINADYVGFLNDDTKVDPKWLEELVKAVKVDKNIVAVGSKILFYDKPNVIAHAGGKKTPIGAGLDIGFGLKESSYSEGQKYAGFVCGAAMLIRKNIFEELGGFDKDYFAYLEDVDLCWRAWLRGYKTIYVPTSIAYHKYGGSWGKRSSPFRIFFTQKNRLANIIKNFELINVIKGFAISLIFDFIRIFSFIIKKNLIFYILLYANIYFLKQLPKNLEKRKKIQKTRKLNDKDMYKLGLILPLRDSIKEFKRLETLEWQ